MEYRHLKYFETVARHGNISRAADELNISQPPLSQQIKLLEDKLGFKLFIRHNKGMKLTGEGSGFLQRVRPLLRQFEEFSDQVLGTQNAVSGTLTIATIPALSGLVGKALKEIWNVFPELHVSVREGHANKVVSLVESREAHIGITRLPIISRDLDYSIIGDDPVRVFLREDDDLANAKRIYPNDLVNKKLILLQLEAENSGFLQIIRALEEAKLDSVITGYMDTISTLLQVVKHGACLTLVPNSSIELAPEGIKAIPFGKTDIHIPAAVVWLKSETNPFVSQVKNLMIQHCRFE